MLDPHQRSGISEATYSVRLLPTILLALAYLGIRAVLAFRDPPGLRWEYVFPPIDVAIVSLFMWRGDQSPIGHSTLLYFFPLVEAAGTLSVTWSVSVAGMVVLGAALASNGFHTVEPFPTVFRYYFFIIVASLAAFLARASATYRQMASVAEDRNRIALEMHDGVQGHLVTIATQMELAARLADRDASQTASIARESRESARLAADELRYLVQRLRSPSLADGFLSSLREFANNICSRHNLNLDFRVVGQSRPLSPEVENALFRIAQEALTNTIKHAGASQVSVHFAFNDHRVNLEIADNGRGIVSTTDSTSNRNGLDSMKARAIALRGNTDVTSTDAGTTVSVEVPA